MCFSLILDILHMQWNSEWYLLSCFHRGDAWLKMHENWVFALSWHDEPQLGALLYIPDVFIRISDLHVALCMYFSWSQKFASGYVEVPLRMGPSAWKRLTTIVLVNGKNCRRNFWSIFILCHLVVGNAADAFSPHIPGHPACPPRGWIHQSSHWGRCIQTHSWRQRGGGQRNRSPSCPVFETFVECVESFKSMLF